MADGRGDNPRPFFYGETIKKPKEKQGEKAGLVFTFRPATIFHKGETRAGERLSRGGRVKAERVTAC